jgi:TonB family protein
VPLSDAIQQVASPVPSTMAALPQIVEPPAMARTASAAVRTPPAVPGASSPQATSGAIAGVVTDQTGAPIADVAVSAVTTSTGAVALGATSGANGQYRLTGLAPGAYTVRFGLPGFRSAAVQVTVAAGATVPTNVSLQLGSVTETLTINTAPDRPAPEPGTQAELQLLDQITRDPLSASNYLALAQLYYTQERFGESERMVDRAVELLDQQSVSQTPAPGASGGDVQPPRKIRDVVPVYPAIARSARVSGLVVIRATISESGTVRDADVVRSAGMLDQSALGAVRQWLYTPTLLNGVPTPVQMTVTVNFVD